MGALLRTSRCVRKGKGGGRGVGGALSAWYPAYGRHEHSSANGARNSRPVPWVSESNNGHTGAWEGPGGSGTRTTRSVDALSVAAARERYVS